MKCDMKKPTKSLFMPFLDTVELQWLEHWWLVYHACLKLIFESLGENPLAADLG